MPVAQRIIGWARVTIMISFRKPPFVAAHTARHAFRATRHLGVLVADASGVPLASVGGQSPLSLLRSVCDEVACRGAACRRLRAVTGEDDVAMRLTAAITREGKLFVAQCLEVDVASQGTSVEEARANLPRPWRCTSRTMTWRSVTRRLTSPSDLCGPVRLARCSPRCVERASSRCRSAAVTSSCAIRRRRTVIVPDHREIMRGTMRSILRQAGLTPTSSRSCCDRTIPFGTACG